MTKILGKTHKPKVLGADTHCVSLSLRHAEGGHKKFPHYRGGGHNKFYRLEKGGGGGKMLQTCDFPIV